MPIIVHDDGLTFSGKFEFEAFLWLEHPILAPSEIEMALALGGDGAGQWLDGARGTVPTWMSRIEADGDLYTTLAKLADRLAAATVFLDQVRTGGGRCGCRVLCKVDFNAQFVLDAALLSRLAALGIDLTIHALDVETPETAEGMRRFLEIMNDPPWKRAGLKDPREESEPDADGPP